MHRWATSVGWPKGHSDLAFKGALEPVGLARSEGTMWTVRLLLLGCGGLHVSLPCLECLCDQH